LNEPLLLLIDASGAMEEFWWENQSTGRKTCIIVTVYVRSHVDWTGIDCASAFQVLYWHLVYLSFGMGGH